MGRFSEMVWRGALKPVKAFLPKNPWLRFLLFAVPVLLVFALVGPALDVLLKVVDLVLRVLEPLLETTVGRIVLLAGLVTTASLLAYWLLRRRVREWRGEAALGRHLQATAALVGQNRRTSRELFRRVARYRGPLPARYPHVVQDARLKLARLTLDQGEVDEALRWLQRVIPAGLPRELERSATQLRLAALRRQGQFQPATLRREAEAAAKRFRDDVVILRVLRDLSVEEGKPDEAVEWQEKVAQHAAPAAARAEGQRLVDMLQDAGARALDAGARADALKIAKRLKKADPDGAAAGLLVGDVHRAAGEHLKAVQAYGGTRSPVGLDRVAELLTEHPGAVEPRELLASCPMQGALLLVARELARAGELERAERAARFAADALGPTPTVCAVLAEVLDLLGDGKRAQLLREQTVMRLLTPAPS